MIGLRIFVSFILLAFAGTGVSTAQIAQETKVKHYKIRGETPLGLVNGMFASGQKSGDRVLLASLSRKIRASIDFPGQSCRDGRVTLKAKFVMRLPKPRHQRKLSKTTAKSFNGFYRFLKKHEEAHRKIVLQCLAREQRKMNQVLAKVRSCAALEDAVAKLESIAAAEGKRCRARHDALDRRDEPKISGFALYRSAKLETRDTGRTTLPNSRLGLSYQPTKLNDRR